MQFTLEELAAARASVCSHKNRTLAITNAPKLTKTKLKQAVQAGIVACWQEMLRPQIASLNLPGLLTLAKMITNRSNQKGWLKIFDSFWIYVALRDLYHSIETAGTGGGLFRYQYATFLQGSGRNLK